ncbi:hypothetical protein AALP_AAs52313U000100, partial [Arabis alpina]
MESMVRKLKQKLLISE